MRFDPPSDLGSKFLFSITFLGLFFILVASMPSDFIILGSYNPSLDYRQVDYPEVWTKSEIEENGFYLSATKNRDFSFVIINFNEHTPSVDYRFKITWGVIENEIVLYHITMWINEWYHSGTTRMNIFEEPNRTTAITKELALQHWDAERGLAKLTPVYCDHITITVWLYDCDPERKDLEASWSEGCLTVGIGFGFDNLSFGLSAWDLAGRLLMFQAPDVHPTINAIINIPLWGNIVYVIAIFSLLLISVLPFT